jgi:hypothetical protein
MGKRSRKPRHEGPRITTEQAPAAEAPPARTRMQERYARGEERNEQIRRNLEPLAPGERPTAVTVAAIVAFVLAVANTVSLVLGETITGSEVTISGVGLSLVLLVCAIFMWQAKYWAVLGFQALLAIQIVIAAGALLVAPGWWQVLVLGVFVVLGGWLFWKLVRALARLQMPERQAPR